MNRRKFITSAGIGIASLGFMENIAKGIDKIGAELTENKQKETKLSQIPNYTETAYVLARELEEKIEIPIIPFTDYFNKELLDGNNKNQIPYRVTLKEEAFDMEYGISCVELMANQINFDADKKFPNSIICFLPELIADDYLPVFKGKYKDVWISIVRRYYVDIGCGVVDIIANSLFEPINN